MMTRNESRFSPIVGRYLMPLPDLSGPAGLPGWEMEVNKTDSLRLVRVAEELIFNYMLLDWLIVTTAGSPGRDLLEQLGVFA